MQERDLVVDLVIGAVSLAAVLYMALDLLPPRRSASQTRPDVEAAPTVSDADDSSPGPEL
jgi:hypothetical protein